MTPEKSVLRKINEVFLTNATVPNDAVIGGVGNGWAVANTTLANERAGLGAGGGHAASSAAVPGTARIDFRDDGLPGKAGEPVSANGSRDATYCSRKSSGSGAS